MLSGTKVSPAEKQTARSNSGSLPQNVSSNRSRVTPATQSPPSSPSPPQKPQNPQNPQKPQQQHQKQKQAPKAPKQKAQLSQQQQSTWWDGSFQDTVVTSVSLLSDQDNPPRISDALLLVCMLTTHPNLHSALPLPASPTSPSLPSADPHVVRDISASLDRGLTVALHTIRRLCASDGGVSLFSVLRLRCSITPLQQAGVFPFLSIPRDTLPGDVDALQTAWENAPAAVREVATSLLSWVVFEHNDGQVTMRNTDVLGSNVCSSRFGPLLFHNWNSLEHQDMILMSLFEWFGSEFADEESRVCLGISLNGLIEDDADNQDDNTNPQQDNGTDGSSNDNNNNDDHHQDDHTNQDHHDGKSVDSDAKSSTQDDDAHTDAQTTDHNYPPKQPHVDDDNYYDDDATTNNNTTNTYSNFNDDNTTHHHTDYDTVDHDDNPDQHQHHHQLHDAVSIADHHTDAESVVTSLHPASEIDAGKTRLYPSLPAHTHTTAEQYIPKSFTQQPQQHQQLFVQPTNPAKPTATSAPPPAITSTPTPAPAPAPTQTTTKAAAAAADTNQANSGWGQRLFTMFRGAPQTATESQPQPKPNASDPENIGGMNSKYLEAIQRDTTHQKEHQIVDFASPPEMDTNQPSHPQSSIQSQEPPAETEDVDLLQRAHPAVRLRVRLMAWEATVRNSEQSYRVRHGLAPPVTESQQPVNARHSEGAPSIVSVPTVVTSANTTTGSVGVVEFEKEHKLRLRKEEEADTANMQLDASRKKVFELMDEISQLRGQLEDQKAQSQTTNASTEALQTQITVLTKKMQEMQARAEGAEQRLQQSAREAENISKKLAEQTQMVQAKERDLKVMEEEMNRLKMEARRNLDLQVCWKRELETVVAAATSARSSSSALGQGPSILVVDIRHSQTQLLTCSWGLDGPHCHVVETESSTRDTTLASLVTSEQTTSTVLDMVVSSCSKHPPAKVVLLVDDSQHSSTDAVGAEAVAEWAEKTKETLKQKNSDASQNVEVVMVLGTAPTQGGADEGGEPNANETQTALWYASAVRWGMGSHVTDDTAGKWAWAVVGERSTRLGLLPPNHAAPQPRSADETHKFLPTIGVQQSVDILKGTEENAESAVNLLWEQSLGDAQTQGLTQAAVNGVVVFVDTDVVSKDVLTSRSAKNAEVLLAIGKRLKRLRSKLSKGKPDGDNTNTNADNDHDNDNAASEITQTTNEAQVLREMAMLLALRALLKHSFSVSQVVYCFPHSWRTHHISVGLGVGVAISQSRDLKLAANATSTTDENEAAPNSLRNSVVQSLEERVEEIVKWKTQAGALTHRLGLVEKQHNEKEAALKQELAKWQDISRKADESVSTSAKECARWKSEAKRLTAQVAKLQVETRQQEEHAAKLKRVVEGLEELAENKEKRIKGLETRGRAQETDLQRYREAVKQAENAVRKKNEEIIVLQARLSKLQQGINQFL